jgi:hypothetical protein
LGRNIGIRKGQLSFYRLASFLTDGIIIVSFIKLSTEQNVALMSGKYVLKMGRAFRCYVHLFLTSGIFSILSRK